MTATITGRAATDRAARYAKQLVSHLGRKIEADFDPESGVGTVRRDDNVCVLTATESTLEFAITAAERDQLFGLMAVVQNHLERFGEKDELACVWDDDSILAVYGERRAEMAVKRAAERAARETEESPAARDAE
ncbi:DUF2218 domain-containing protein [Demequina sp. NBRC 110052]|uniref:DUF2218 domain-containing protein n=1 Tax=Demequina sp. NBRC 110052 TaxID=1570341 RepID=UPI000A07483C|nr:DUF2218 domain-containing protein [Demequina sp. NBRC 110052]